MNPLLTFRKAERLSYRNEIVGLFNTGLSFNAPPFRVLYRTVTAEPGVPVKVLITVSKRKFKRAVDRNRLRRLIREAYRLHKQELIGQAAEWSCCLHVGFIYTGDRKDITFREIEQPLVRCLERLKKIIAGTGDQH